MKRTRTVIDLVLVTAGIIGRLHWKSRDAADAVVGEQARWDDWGNRMKAWLSAANGCTELPTNNGKTNPGGQRRTRRSLMKACNFPFAPDGGVVSGKYA